MTSHKIAKISSDMVRVISEIVTLEARDEFLKMITITDCKVSSDLSYAKVYFTSLSNKDKKDILKEMKEAAPYIRGLVASKLDLRHTPEIEFIYDDSIEYADRIEKIIKKIHEGE